MARGKARALLLNSTLALSSLLVLLVLAEFLLTAVIPVVYRPRVTRVDRVLGWTHTPSVSVTGELEGHPLRVSYNDLGYRGPEHAFENPSGRARVVILGDSFVDGAEAGDEEVHTAHLQRTMSAEVINLGVYGYSTAQELLTLREVGARFGPDLVVLVTVSNDFTDNIRNFSHFGPAPRFRLEADSLVLEPADGPVARETFRATNLPAPFMSFLHRHSTLYYVLNHFIYQRLAGPRITRILQDQDDARSRAERWELYRRLVHRMNRMSDEAGARFLLVFAYLRGEVVGNDTSPYAEILEQLSADGILVYDLFDDLKATQEASEESLWYEEDIHWSPLGHRTVAELLRPKLESILESGHMPATTGQR